MKKIFNIVSISIVFILVAVMVSCDDKPEVYDFPVDEYFYEIPDVPVTQDYVVGVRYDRKSRDSIRISPNGPVIPNHGNDLLWWDNGQARGQWYTGTPKLGEYDTRRDSATVIRKHMDWGRQAGIDFFVITWGGRGYTDTILMQFDRLWREGDPRIVIRFDPNYLHNRTGWGNDTLMLNPGRMDTLRHDFDSLYVNVMQKQFAYKHRTTGYPVAILCEFVNKRGDIINLKEFVNFFRKENMFTGQPNNLFLIGELGGSIWTSPENWGWHPAPGQPGHGYGVIRPDTIGALEAMYTNDYQHSNYDRYLGQYSFLDYNYTYWRSKLEPMGKEYIPTIYPAFDNRISDFASNQFFIPRWREGVDTAYIVSSIQKGIKAIPSLPAQQVNPNGMRVGTVGTGNPYNFSDITKNPYQQWANVAKRNAGNSRIIMVRSWNDFQQGNTLEPTEEYGEDYLNYTKRFFKRP
jgi:hypothetical protein